MDKKINSGKLAIAVALLIAAGILVYFSWKSSSSDEVKQESSQLVQQDTGQKDIENWKIFRNDVEGYEFRLPREWSLKEESGKFFNEKEAGEIVVIIEEKNDEYSTEKLLEESKQAEGQVEVQPLDEVSGVKIEKKESDSLNQTAKFIQGDDIITLTYVSRSAQAEETFNMIMPTFKSVN